VLLGKRVLGETPLVELPLPVGHHRLRLINETEHVDTVIEVTIKASQTTVKKVAF
jgi:serine/threonine-protein kinase